MHRYIDKKRKILNHSDNIWVVDADGKNLKKLTDGKMDLGPQWIRF
jgi:cytochrome oxidase Cu insertion factor (SCO1/SenC/PrrC family)